MKRQPFLNLLFITLGVVTLLGVLVNFSDLPNTHKNGFLRQWVSGKITPLHETGIRVPLQQICGAATSHLFFTVPNPRGLIMIDTGLQRQDSLLYGLPLTSTMTKANNTFVDSPNIYFFVNNIPALYRGRLNDPVVDIVNLGASTFTRSEWMSPNRIFLRTLTSDHQMQVFQKRDSHTGLMITEATIVANQGLGGFGSDGLLRYDPSAYRLLYISYYQNLFYCMDTSLRLLYQSRTIDTIRTNPVLIKPILFGKETRLMPATPRVCVNQECCIDGGTLFVVSGLKADNELDADFRNNAVVDRYVVESGHYAGSFYIPNTEGETLKSFFIRGNLLIVLYKSHIRTFRLHS